MQPFQRFLFSEESKIIAKKLKVTQRAIDYWRNKSVMPSAKHMARIVKISKGRVTFGDIAEFIGSRAQSKR